MTPPTDARTTPSHAAPSRPVPSRTVPSRTPPARRAPGRTAARTASAAILTAALICSPVLAGASAASATYAYSGTAHSDTVSIEAPGGDSGSSDPPPVDGDAQLGGSSASAAELGASQEGSWFLGQSVDSVLGPGQWYTAREGRTWYGAYRTFSDRYSYCTDAGLKTPHPRFFRNAGAGKSITAARTAWALHTHRESSSAATHAALSAMVRLDEAIPHRHAIPPGHPKDLGSDFAEAAKAYTTISRDAKRYAGPYTLDVTLRDRTIRALDVPTGEDSGRDDTTAASADVTQEDSAAGVGLVMDAVVSLTSASGHEVPGHDVDLTVTGAQPAQDRVTTSDDPTTVDMLAQGDVPITIEVEVDGLPSSEVSYHRPSGLGSDRVQAVVTPGEPVTLTAEDTWKQKEQPPRPTLPPSPPPSPLPVPTATATYSPPAPPTQEPEPSTTPEATPPPTTTPPPAPTRTPEPPRTPEASEPPEAPETEVPETETPETEAPETEVPKTEQPETEAPETTPPEETAPPEGSPPPEDTAPPQEDEQPGPPPQGGGEPPAPQEPSPPDNPVPAPDGPQPETLPRTGVDATAAAGLALILVAVGTGALTLARRR